MSYPKSPHQQVRSIKSGLLVHIRQAGKKHGLDNTIQKFSPLLRELSVKRLQNLATSLDASTEMQARAMIDEALHELAE